MKTSNILEHIGFIWIGMAFGLFAAHTFGPEQKARNKWGIGLLVAASVALTLAVVSDKKNQPRDTSKD